MDYVRGIVRALIPKKKKDMIAMAILVPLFSYVGFKTFVVSPPNVTIHSETQYPKEVVRGQNFYLAFDLSWDRTCELTAKRYITGSDGVEYLAQEDLKTVIKDERTRFIARIPVDQALPLGNAKMRSDFQYSCDWWSKYIAPIKARGRERFFNIVAQESKSIASATDETCGLKPEPGFTIVRAHYRRLPKYTAAKL